MSANRNALSWGLLVLLVQAPGLFAGSTPELISVHIFPSEATISGAHAAQQFVVLGTYGDGLERDVTAASLFSISDSRYAQVSPKGLVAGVSDGTTVLHARFNGREATAALRVQDSQRERAAAFERDIVPIFTKRGCNGSSCHGGVKGKGGFKLSMDGIAPREDYPWIVEGGGYQVLSPEPKGPRKPRINLQQPEQSLLLQKPTFAVPHGGGKRLDISSEDYRAILNWIRNGAKFGNTEAGASHLERIELFPEDAVLEQKAKRQILVAGYFSDGRRTDLTGLASFESMNPEIVKVTPDGTVEAIRPGEAAVLIRSEGRTVGARVGVIAKPLEKYPAVSRRNLIDDRIFDKLRRYSVLPSENSSDAEFLRRVCLDLTGTLPPPERVRQFTADPSPQKRDNLIETLLNSPEYVDFWTFRFGALFQATPKFRAPRTYAFWEWVYQSVSNNKPYDQMAREYIAAQGYEGPAMHYIDKVPIERVVAEQTRLFLGRRLDCAQCHNHPFDVGWTQDQFWGMAAFFNRLTRTGWSSDNVVYDDPDGEEIDLGAMGVRSLAFIKAIHPRTRKEVEPRFFDGRKLPLEANTDIRGALAKQLTSHPYFAEAAVNRMWGYFFGRGIVDPIDDFRATNPPTHPDLLHALARDFAQHGYDLKYLIRFVVQSNVYQLSSTPNATNRADESNYSHALNRRLEAEVLLDAISGATGIAETFQAGAGKAPAGTRAINLKAPGGYASRFLDVFGRSSSEKANLSQALHMLAGSTYTGKLGEPGGRVDGLLRGGASDREIVEALYLATVSRFPSDEERTQLEGMIRQQASRQTAVQDLLYALISSREFAYNH